MMNNDFSDQITGKMKTIRTLLLIILALGISSALAAQKDSKGRQVKSILVYQEKYDMLVSRKYKETEQNFDQHGNILEDITYKQGKIKKHFKYQYDTDNNKIREEEYDPSGRLIEFSEYKYENGMRIEKNVYDANKKLKSRKTYQYTTY